MSLVVEFDLHFREIEVNCTTTMAHILHGIPEISQILKHRAYILVVAYDIRIAALKYLVHYIICKSTVHMYHSRYYLIPLNDTIRTDLHLTCHCQPVSTGI